MGGAWTQDGDDAGDIEETLACGVRKGRRCCLVREHLDWRPWR